MSVRTLDFIFVEQPKHPRGSRPKSVGDSEFFKDVTAPAAASAHAQISAKTLGKRASLSGSQSAHSSPHRNPHSSGLSPDMQRLMARASKPSARVLFAPSPRHRVDFEAVTREVLQISRQKRIEKASGQEGPTFLLNDFVLKSTTPQEAAFNYLYAAFASDEFSVPETEALNLSTGLHSSAKLSKQYSAPRTEAVSKNFHSFAKICGAALSDERPVLMHMEKISGTNLFDFARYTFATLTKEEQKQFLENLGAVAFLDLLAGQHDRLIPASFDEDTGFSFDFGNVNLGNVLTDGRKLSLIDNGVAPDLIHNVDNRQENYSGFVLGLLKTESMELALAQQIAEGLKLGIDLCCDEDVWVKPEPGPRIQRNAVFEQFKPFLAYLDEEGISALAEGMRTMRDRLKRSHVFVFVELEDHLDTICPGFSAPLKKRFGFL